jgi:hypothetical protein
MAREPCGEDIVDTETERSEDSDEDEYEDLEVYPPSPVSDGGGMSKKQFASFFLMIFFI